MRVLVALTVSSFLAGCGGNPFLDPAEDPGGTSDNPVDELPGTDTPSASRGIVRYEDVDDGTGNGYAQSVTYDVGTDTFEVDNLGFDGANAYTRSATEPSAYPFGLYESATVVTDPVSGNPIPQFVHRLVGGDSGKTSFAIVRTGAYTSYGFGGFVLQREGGVTLPTTGQAVFNGDYAGLRDFNGKPGLEVTSGTTQVAIDFEDFNAGDAVQGTISNRRIYDLNGADITATIVDSINAKYNPDGTGLDIANLPVLNFRVGPGAIDANGEIRGFLDSWVGDYRGGKSGTTTFETGNYYAIVAGDTPDEVVGVIVVEGEDPLCDNCTARETGGFIAYR